MAEVASTTFDNMTDSLSARVEQGLVQFAQEHGRVFDAASMAQSHIRIGELAQDALTFGMDVWPNGEDERPVPATPDNVLPFVKLVRPTLGKITRMCLAFVGLIGAGTIVAAATTDAVSLPGMRYVAEVIYAHNLPEREVFTVIHEGRTLRVHGARVGSDDMNRIVVERIEQIDGPVPQLDTTPEMAGATLLTRG